MPTRHRPYGPNQVMPLPAAPQGWPPLVRLAYFIHDTVDALDHKAFYARYEGGGWRNQPFKPSAAQTPSLVRGGQGGRLGTKLRGRADQ